MWKCDSALNIRLQKEFVYRCFCLRKEFPSDQWLHGPVNYLKKQRPVELLEPQQWARVTVHSKLSVFKGRTRQLTKAIFWTLAQKAQTSAYDIYKEVRTQKVLRHTRYSVVNRRVRTLEELGYIERTGTKKTKAGFKAPLYQLTPKAYLTILLNQSSLEDFIEQADEVQILTAL